MEQAARPGEFAGENGKPDRDHDKCGTRKDKHGDADQQDYQPDGKNKSAPHVSQHGRSPPRRPPAVYVPMFPVDKRPAATVFARAMKFQSMLKFAFNQKVRPGSLMRESCTKPGTMAPDLLRCSA